MNNRIKKKHMWLGTKRAGCSYCSNEIGHHIHRLLEKAGIKPIRRNIMRYLHWFLIHSTEKEWMERVDRAYIPQQMLLSAKHLLPRPTYDQMVLYSRLIRAIDTIKNDNTVGPPVDIMGLRQALDRCLQDIPEEDDVTRNTIESLCAGLASCSKTIDDLCKPILKEFVPQMTKEELDEWAHKLKVNEPPVFKPFLVEPEPTGFIEGYIAPEFRGNKLTGFSLCKPINVGNRVGDVIRGHRLTDMESEDSAYTESMKHYTFDGTVYDRKDDE